MSRTKVLVVEDDPKWWQIFQILVGESTKELFDYTNVVSLKDALAEIQKGGYDLVLLDLMLPDSHALKTIEIIASKSLFIPIIILTTLDDEKLILNAFQHDIQDYLVKDKYDINVFLHVCRRTIQRFIGKLTASLQEDVEKIIVNLRGLDIKLEEIQLKLSKQINTP